MTPTKPARHPLNEQAERASDLHDEHISALYQQLPPTQPNDFTDARIRASARSAAAAALAAAQQRHKTQLFRLKTVAASAASLLLCVGLVAQWQHHEPAQLQAVLSTQPAADARELVREPIQKQAAAPARSAARAANQAAEIEQSDKGAQADKADKTALKKMAATTAIAARNEDAQKEDAEKEETHKKEEARQEIASKAATVAAEGLGAAAREAERASPRAAPHDTRHAAAPAALSAPIVAAPIVTAAAPSAAPSPAFAADAAVAARSNAAQSRIEKNTAQNMAESKAQNMAQNTASTSADALGAIAKTSAPAELRYQTAMRHAQTAPAFAAALVLWQRHTQAAGAADIRTVIDGDILRAAATPLPAQQSASLPTPQCAQYSAADLGAEKPLCDFLSAVKSKARELKTSDRDDRAETPRKDAPASEASYRDAALKRIKKMRE